MSSDDIPAAIDPASEKAKSSVHAAKDKAAVATSQAMHGARESARSSAQDAAAEVSEGVGAAAGVYARAKDAVQGLSDRLPDGAADAYRTGRRAYAQGSDTVADRVTKQPIEALLLAGALGYLVGWATSCG